MGRLIDIDVLFDYFGNDAINETTRSNIEYFVSEKGTVKAIPIEKLEQIREHFEAIAHFNGTVKADYVLRILDKAIKEVEQ